MLIGSKLLAFPKTMESMDPRSKEDFLNGQILLLDKPLGWSSFQVVNKVRWTLRKKFGLKKIKVGHAGTLDPLATGLLVLCTGRFTKQIEQLQGKEKEYTGIITLGATTPSFDLETEVDRTFSLEGLTDKGIEEAAQRLTGEIEQVPPIFSAVKKDGKRLYEYARKGEQVVIRPRKVSVVTFEILAIDLPKVEFRIVCGKGTYIRSLARDLGLLLGNGAHLSRLRRTKIGDYYVNKALGPEEFEALLLGR